MSRREQTEARILQALGEQIRATGMAGVGINAVAKRAKVSKELIYRYFEGFPGLMSAWMQKQDFWSSHPDLLGDDESSQRPPVDLILSMLHAQIGALAGNETLMEVRRWELIERNEVTAHLAERRERAARSFVDRVDGLTDEADVPAMISIMLAGVLYLMLRSKTEGQFLGVPLRTNEGWARFYAAIEHLARAFPEDLQRESLATLEALRKPACDKKDAA
ncbi:TetR/AcrR family transcriptional regulator [Verminephrobacter eiseniae]|uniref:Transcriptional regulator, TetR family n=1 Tax=Verminephrobacter eiseniae (strain EF01-2) TaxID=391735 RepID=A1WJE4_VEREI|nr:TetR/AcrR family transcriptional regulator [Verminephrobacter eiseniae]ABM57751.1 transcriptional regulator, TetR family [Verminephrobacter eiseniae EF01-2]MCW5283363.1 TetR/AcrR family transcriptional regulator [Verminephrobacter eiseniae]MCW5301072.1 TetR/AcrR family transcriptional regulator [Verminephrobacter eiseniae]MCW8180288.1 TetR/AcrR family transcriptional regulator [Verminephrobacter eiseniae]MCW8192514.1 TetR/AcrR family transcriptional regulator [Verminephrobacter eiseniae]